ncbi:hypothetical protein Hjap01_01237 [Haloarcula japonica]
MSVAEDDRSDVPSDEFEEQRRILPCSNAVEQGEIQQR